jgi:hypothetical protein
MISINIDPMVNHIMDLPWEQSCAALKWYVRVSGAYYYARPKSSFFIQEAKGEAKRYNATSIILEDMS